ncbi:MAG TPA: Asp-tRNA(Asn)/Glu-tRNA(Gln) amidotransferase subunit GatB [Polyangiaceae bacterium]|jgi:aspartyl-tRNA(Asn)/glutamyl-tRNA(Gln) amidotransferase subunit B|nr:Asp-tRNA(Asn)/Glu-tRNA(Gln) amidotransferase subunit GatB [Polyangiaceae bacterium]
MTEYEPVIGLEVHSQLLTKSKLFCSCSTNFGGAPNTNVCPVCLGLPGSLPVLNREAVTMAVQAGLALNCTIHEKSIFARKNYFYPDLPKGYQISQFEEPIATKGYLDIELDGVVKRVGITRAHMEEDAGKNLHGVAGDSLVDLNRAGTPLVEIVGDPDLRSSAEAAAYMRALRDILVFIGVNDGNLEEGSFRCDANVSIRPKGTEPFGTRCELKNINSFKFVQRAIDAEIIRQTAILDAGGKIRQETRSFDPDTGLTHTLRSKEEAHDYRYFPEPDLPPLRVEAAFVAAARERLNELPQAVRKRWVAEFALTPATAQTLTQHPEYVRFFEAVLKGFNQPVKVANFVANDVLRGAKSHGLQATFTVNPVQVAELLALVDSGEISGKQGKEVYAALEGTGKSARSIVDERGLRVVSDSGALEAVCSQLIEKYPSQAASLRSGKKGLMGFFVGQAMKETGGSANPKLLNELLDKLLGGPS